MCQIRSTIKGVLIALGALCLLLAAWNRPGVAQSINSSTPNTDVQRVIHDYILAHPEVLIESLRLAKQKEDQRNALNTKLMIASFKKDLVEDSNAPIFGNPLGDITLVEFFDYRCPYCRQVDPFLRTLIKDDPGVRVVQKQYPVLGPDSVFAARMALAAQKQGKHGQLHDALMEKKPNINSVAMLKVAEEIGLDMQRLKSDMNSPDVDAELRRNVEIGTALRLTGTPAIIVGTELVPGATDLATLKAMIYDARRAND
jgi:protein-disulfide isomerase